MECAITRELACMLAGLHGLPSGLITLFAYQSILGGKLGVGSYIPFVHFGFRIVEDLII